MWRLNSYLTLYRLLQIVSSFDTVQYEDIKRDILVGCAKKCLHEIPSGMFLLKKLTKLDDI